MNDDFGHRLEAALTDRLCYASRNAYEITLAVRDAVRAANAQVSAPAPVTGESPAQSVDISGAGAGVDLADAMCEVKHAADGDIEWANLAQHEARALLSHIESLERDAAQYAELIFAVGRKYDGETRQQTALRYIRQAEAGNNIAARKEGK